MPISFESDLDTKIYSWLGYPFGKQYSITGAGYNNYRFTGKEYDASTGFYYFGARYYMPEIGRFITADPVNGWQKLRLKEPMNLSLYGYCADNPLRLIDITGKSYINIEWMHKYNQWITKEVENRLGFAPKWARWIVTNILQQSPSDIIAVAGTGIVKAPSLGKHGGIIMKVVEIQTDKKGNPIIKLVQKEVIAETRDLKPWVKSLEESAGMYETLQESAQATNLQDVLLIYSKTPKTQNLIHKIFDKIRKVFY